MVRAANVSSVENATSYDQNISEVFTEKRCYYINRTGQPVYIKDRQGVHLTIPPHMGDNSRRGLNAFYVVYEYITPFDCMPISLDYPSARINTSSSHSITKRLTIEYSISPAEFNPLGKPVYLPNVGLMLSFKHSVESLEFPDTTKEGLNKYAEYIAKRTEKHSLWISLIIVDNQSEEPRPYWVNIENRVFRIQSIRHVDLEDGVYFRSNQEAKNPHLQGKFETHYSIEDCLYTGKNPDAPILLFESPTEAEFNGNTERRTKEQVDKLDKEIKEREHTLNLRKQELEELKLKNTEIKENVAVQSDVRKDYYEERSTLRKDESETFKMVSSVIGMVGGIFAGIVAIFKLVRG